MTAAATVAIGPPLDYMRKVGAGMQRHRLRVGDLARAKGYNINTFGFAAKLSAGSARVWWYGKVNKFDGDVLERIADSLDVTISDLFEAIPQDADPGRDTTLPTGHT